jgi:hypothetical protein
MTIVYELFLGHRHDYTGHFAAGYGATLGALILWLRLLERDSFVRRSSRWIVPVCLLCITGGAVAEATAFRIAIFDEVDFCNQSIGATLAAVCAMSCAGRDLPPEKLMDRGLIAGVVFLGIGGVLAVA